MVAVRKHLPWVIVPIIVSNLKEWQELFFAALN